MTSLSVTADSSVLVSASEDGTARSWHVASRQCVHKTEGVGGKGGGGGGGAVSQVLLLPLPEALMMIRAAAGGGGGGGGGGGRKRQSLPLAPFDKFMRSTSGKVCMCVCMRAPAFFALAAAAVVVYCSLLLVVVVAAEIMLLTSLSWLLFVDCLLLWWR